MTSHSTHNTVFRRQGLIKQTTHLILTVDNGCNEETANNLSVAFLSHLCLRAAAITFSLQISFTSVSGCSTSRIPTDWLPIYSQKPRLIRNQQEFIVAENLNELLTRPDLTGGEVNRASVTLCDITRLRVGTFLEEDEDIAYRPTEIDAAAVALLSR